jgi:hypothetical protein
MALREARSLSRPHWAQERLWPARSSQKARLVAAHFCPATLPTAKAEKKKKR